VSAVMVDTGTGASAEWGTAGVGIFRVAAGGVRPLWPVRWVRFWRRIRAALDVLPALAGPGRPHMRW
jgi:hypothetical protein